MTGKHRAVVERTGSTTTLRSLAVLGTGTAILFSCTASASAATQISDEALNLLAECESGGRNVQNGSYDATHTAQGYYQITNSTWRAHGGTQFAPTAMQATAAQQTIIARRIAEARPSFADWNPSRSCWGPRIGAAMAGRDVTKVAVASGGTPAAAPAPAPPVTERAEPAPEPLPTPTAPTSGAQTWTVSKGETLRSIATASGHSVDELAAWNGLSRPFTIYPGQTLRLAAPATSPTPANPAPPVTPPQAQEAPAAPATPATPATPAQPSTEEAPATPATPATPHLPAPGSLSPGNPKAPAGAAVADADGRYHIQYGDVLWKIAADNHTTARELAEQNHLADPDLILAGNELEIGGQGIGPALNLAGSATSWRPQVAMSVRETADRFGITTVMTRPGHQPTQDRAADFMTYGNVAKQQEMAAWVIANHDRLGVEYIISRQRIAGAWTGWRWEAMKDRHTPTQNHMDHNHVAYLASFAYTGTATTAPAPAASAAPASGGHGRDYVVRRGDTLSKIARSQHVAGGWRAVYDANKATVRNPNRIFPGQHLVLVSSDGTHNLFGATPSVP